MPPNLESGKTYALLNLRLFYYFAFPGTYPTRTGLEADDPISPRAAEDQTFIVNIETTSPLTFRLTNYEKDEPDIVLLDGKENTEVKAVRRGRHGPVPGSNVWEIGASKGGAFSDYYRIRNVKTKTCLVAKNVQTKQSKVVGCKAPATDSQYWKFIRLVSDHYYEINKQLMKAQRVEWERLETDLKTKLAENGASLDDAIKEGQDHKARADDLERQVMQQQDQLVKCTCEAGEGSSQTRNFDTTTVGRSGSSLAYRNKN